MNTITVCIPTYNRIGHLLMVVNEILSCNNPRVHIYVQDNCSTDETKKELSLINSSQLHVRINDKPLDGRQNIVDAMSRASGDYVLLCLDKDFIKKEALIELLDVIDKYHPVQGYIDISTVNEEKPYVFYKKGYDSILATSYRGKHPSGSFYKTDVFYGCSHTLQIQTLDSTFPFWFDVINAHISLVGNSVAIQKAFVVTESKENAIKEKSFSYNEENFYMHPVKRNEEYAIYFKDLWTLNISDFQKVCIALKLFHNGLSNSTYIYKKSMMDEYITIHYNVKKRKVSYSDMFNYAISYLNMFINNSKGSLSLLQRSYIILIGGSIWILKLLKSLISQ